MGLDTGSLQLDCRSMETLVTPAMREAIQGAAALGRALPGNIIDATIASNPVEQIISSSMLWTYERYVLAGIVSGGMLTMSKTAIS